MQLPLSTLWFTAPHIQEVLSDVWSQSLLLQPVSPSSSGSALKKPFPPEDLRQLVFKPQKACSQQEGS